MPFAGDIKELPGFQPPDSPRLDDRVFCRPDGSLDFLFLANQPDVFPGKEYQIDISWSFGPEIVVLATLHSSLIFPVRKAGPLVDLFLRVPRDIVYFWPGNYRLNGYELVSGDEVFAKSLVVKSSPRQVTQASPSLIRYTVGYGFSAPSQPAPPKFTGWPAPVMPPQWPPVVVTPPADDRWVTIDGVRTVPIKPGTMLGSGSPEGVVSAEISTEYVDLATGSQWFKTSAPTPDTGWECPNPRTGTAPVPPAPCPIPPVVPVPPVPPVPGSSGSSYTAIRGDFWLGPTITMQLRAGTDMSGALVRSQLRRTTTSSEVVFDFVAANHMSILSDAAAGTLTMIPSIPEDVTDNLNGAYVADVEVSKPGVLNTITVYNYTLTFFDDVTRS